jgi:protein ImuB
MEGGERRARVAAVHLPRFLIQRRLREDARLAHRPVAIVRDKDEARLVTAASQKALMAGVRLGTTAPSAKALCPGLVLLPDDPAGDVRALEALGEAALAASPHVELCGPLGLFCDTSAAPLFAGKAAGQAGGEAGLVQVLLDRARALGYRAQVVLADNKFTAMTLAVHRPSPAVVTGPAREALAPLPLSALPSSAALSFSLSAMGLLTLGQFAALPPAGVLARFGEEGALLQRLARGEDPRPLFAFRPAPPLVENLSLSFPAEALEPVLFALKTVLDRLTARLSGRGLAVTRVEIQLALAPSGETRVTLPLSRPTASSRLILSVFRGRLCNIALTAPVAGVGVEALDVWDTTSVTPIVRSHGATFVGEGLVPSRTPQRAPAHPLGDAVTHGSAGDKPPPHAP